MYAAPLQLSPPQQMGMQDSAQDTGSMGSAGTTAVPASNDLQSTVGVWRPPFWPLQHVQTMIP